jgi:hypothetical protein
MSCTYGEAVTSRSAIEGQPISTAIRSRSRDVTFNFSESSCLAHRVCLEGPYKIESIPRVSRGCPTCVSVLQALRDGIGRASDRHFRSS